MAVSPAFFEPAIIGAGPPIVWPEPDTWTLVDSWATHDGDMGGKAVWPPDYTLYPTYGNPHTGIWSPGNPPTSYYTVDDSMSWNWSPDGKHLTVTYGGNDRMTSFTAATAFDPNTLSWNGNSTYFWKGPDCHRFVSGSRFIATGGLGAFGGVNQGTYTYNQATDYSINSFSELDYVGYDNLDMWAGRFPPNVDGEPSWFPITDVTGNRCVSFGIDKDNPSNVQLKCWSITDGLVGGARFINKLEEPLGMSKNQDGFVNHTTYLSSLNNTAYFYFIGSGGFNDVNYYRIFKGTVKFHATTGALTDFTVDESAGRKFTDAELPGTIHSRISTLHIDPDNPKYVWVGTDSNRGNTWALLKFDTGM